MGRLRSGRRRRDATPEDTTQAGPSNQEAPAEEEVTWHPVWVAIYEGAGTGAFKHWAIFVEDEQDVSRSFICHAEGSAGRFRYEQKRHNAHGSRTLLEIIQVGHVSSNNLKAFRDVGKRMPVKNHDMTWNCQDFAWDLLEALASEGIIDGDDELYTNGRQTVWSQMEGLV